MKCNVCGSTGRVERIPCGMCETIKARKSRIPAFINEDGFLQIDLKQWDAKQTRHEVNMIFGAKRWKDAAKIVPVTEADKKNQ